MVTVDVRRLATGAALAICGMSAGLVFIRPAAAIGYDGSIMLQVAKGVVRHGSLTVHGVPNSSYSSYGIGLSLVEVPVVFVADHLARNADQWAMAVNALLLGALLPVIFLLALQLQVKGWQAALTALLGGLCTPLLAYAPTELSEPGTALGIAIALLGLAAAQRRRGWGAIVAGAGAGAACLMRSDSLVLVLPIVATGIVAIDRRVTTLLRFVVALVPFLLVIAWYDEMRYGLPWRQGYQGQVFNHALTAGIYGFLVSPAKSIFLYAPIALVAAVGIWWALRRWPAVTAVAIGLLLVRIPFYSAWYAWDGGWAWGPRYLVPGTVGLVVPLVEVIRRISAARPPAWIAVGVVVLASLGVQVVGAVWPYGPSRILQAYVQLAPLDASKPAVEAKYDAIDSDWRLFPIADQARQLVRTPDAPGYLFLPRPLQLALAALVLASALGALRLTARGDPP